MCLGRIFFNVVAVLNGFKLIHSLWHVLQGSQCASVCIFLSQYQGVPI